MWSDVKRIFHFGPITALTVIKIITFTTLFLTSQWLHFTDSFFAVVNYLSYYSFIAIVLYNFFSAVFVGPGLTPLQWRPKELEDCKYVQYCGQCDGYKPPRAHHCRRCERCVLKMDHHCPWINNCVGYRNQCHFTLFLFTAVLGSIQSLILLIVGLYRALYSNWYLYNDRPDRFVYLSMTSLLFGIFSVGLSLGVIIAVGGLLFLQIKILVRNQTSIEEWIITKAKSRKRDDVFLFPYDLGFWRNVKQVLFGASDNGFVWPVIEGCNQYTLTVEQLLQKEEKKSRSATYRAVGDYNGSWFPLFSQGWRVCISFPITDEPRIAITSGDDVLVTRWKKRWLYGEKLKICGNKRERGWFPRHIVAQVYIAKHNEQQQQVNNGSNRNFYTNVTKDDKKSD